MTRADSVYELRLSESLVNAIGARLRQDVYEALSDLRLAQRADYGVEARRSDWQEACARLDAFVDARAAALVVQDDQPALFDPWGAS